MLTSPLSHPPNSEANECADTRKNGNGSGFRKNVNMYERPNFIEPDFLLAPGLPVDQRKSVFSDFVSVPFNLPAIPQLDFPLRSFARTSFCDGLPELFSRVNTALDDHSATGTATHEVNCQNQNAEYGPAVHRDPLFELVCC